jgi:small-conductance mechanosensitive channel
MPWYRDRRSWRFVGRYLACLAGLNLAWEVSQLPLYTIWSQAPLSELAFAVAHCTLGDVLIGAAALLIALLAVRAPAVEQWNWIAVGLLAVFVGVAYTAFSEWTNTTIRNSWQYSSLMPLVRVGSVGIGLSPLAQWLVLPPLALYFSRRPLAWS